MITINRGDNTVSGEISMDARDKLWEHLVTMFGPGVLKKIAESKTEALHEKTSLCLRINP